MRTFILLLFLLHRPTGGSTVLHTLRFFVTVSSGVTNFPEFVAVGYVDDVQISYHDNAIRRAVPKQDWIKDPAFDHFFQRYSAIALGIYPLLRADLSVFQQRFNHTGGVHVYQRMFGCEWDDETGEVDGSTRLGYDGEDFLSLDVKGERWIAARPQAVSTKLRWDTDTARMAYLKYYYTQECPDTLRNIVTTVRSALMRTELPSIQLLQRSPSSPVTCHATGFYPRYAVMFWRRDQEEEVFEGVDHGEMLPNPDGSFQMSVDLNISVIRAEDWSRYDCVFQIKGVQEDLTVTLDKRRILTNWRKSDGGVAAAVVGGLLLLLLVAVSGFFLWRKRSGGFQRAHTSDASSSSAGESEMKTEQRGMLTPPSS